VRSRSLRFQIAQHRRRFPTSISSPRRVVVLDMTTEVLGELVDALGEQRDLDLGGAGVVGGAPVLADQLRLLFPWAKSWQKEGPVGLRTVWKLAQPLAPHRRRGASGQQAPRRSGSGARHAIARRMPIRGLPVEVLLMVDQVGLAQHPSPTLEGRSHPDVDGGGWRLQRRVDTVAGVTRRSSVSGWRSESPARALAVALDHRPLEQNGARQAAQRLFGPRPRRPGRGSDSRTPSHRRPRPGVRRGSRTRRAPAASRDRPAPWPRAEVLPHRDPLRPSLSISTCSMKPCPGSGRSRRRGDHDHLADPEPSITSRSP